MAAALFLLATAQQGIAEVEAGPRKERIERHGALQFNDGRNVLAALVQGRAEAVVVLGHGRIGSYSAGIRRFGRGVVVELEMGLAEVIPCLAVVVL